MQTVGTAIYVPSSWLEPLDWREVFGNDRRIEVDVGCGKGSFLLWSAQMHPDANFVGVDRLLRRLRKIDRKIQRLGLMNARLMRVEAGYLTGYLVPKASVSAYHIYFPDPWPKRRHRQRRLMSTVFLSSLHRTLLDGGSVNCATDHEEYFQWIQEEFGKIGGFTETRPEIPREGTETDFEREFLAAGKKIHRCRWVKG
ncbi:MAG TPA: tRNA (guanosine(46)-N7)-methyltransferase TrmB [Verrucomicrobiae bacterium]|nr:tRNA (guanosine(46)-N7)-methyltransferase TrmB [Verrucomicrobiae bacterium]